MLETVASLASSLSASDGDDGDAENDMVVAGVTTGAKLVDTLLSAAETVEESTAVAATSALNNLVEGLQGLHGDVGGSESSSTNVTAAASSVGRAVSSLGARAVEARMTQSVSGLSAALPPPLALRSANINLTLTVTEPAALGDEPFVCDSASTPVEVALPPGMIKLLGAGGQGTEDEPVGVVFTVPILTGSNSDLDLCGRGRVWP